MRRKNETATSFNELKAITQAIMLKKGAPKNATNQESERTQASANANISDLTQGTTLKPKSSAQAKKHALNPTKRAFSERQITAFRDNSQASDEKRTKQANQQGDNANAFTPEQANNSNLREKPSKQAFKPGLATHQEKGGSDE
ncbi:hypothetical protein [Helicobacter phage Is3180G]|nr:hypothetical protein [Helicobacter phage Is3180G]